MNNEITLCESCLVEGIKTPATTHSNNPDFSGYELCEECAKEYDSRSPLCPCVTS